MNNVWEYFLLSLCATFIGVSIYEWIKSERDERQWRKILEAEKDGGLNPTFTYRLVRDERSERE